MWLRVLICCGLYALSQGWCFHDRKIELLYGGGERVENFFYTEIGKDFTVVCRAKNDTFDDMYIMLNGERYNASGVSSEGEIDRLFRYDSSKVYSKLKCCGDIPEQDCSVLSCNADIHSLHTYRNPLPPSNLSCVYDNWSEVICSWGPTVEAQQTHTRMRSREYGFNYTINWQLIYSNGTTSSVQSRGQMDSNTTKFLNLDKVHMLNISVVAKHAWAKVQSDWGLFTPLELVVPSAPTKVTSNVSAYTTDISIHHSHIGDNVTANLTYRGQWDTAPNARIVNTTGAENGVAVVPLDVIPYSSYSLTVKLKSYDWGPSENITFETPPAAPTTNPIIDAHSYTYKSVSFCKDVGKRVCLGDNWPSDCTTATCRLLLIYFDGLEEHQYHGPNCRYSVTDASGTLYGTIAASLRTIAVPVRINTTVQIGIMSKNDAGLNNRGAEILKIDVPDFQADKPAIDLNVRAIHNETSVVVQWDKTGGLTYKVMWCKGRMDICEGDINVSPVLDQTTTNYTIDMSQFVDIRQSFIFGVVAIETQQLQRSKRSFQAPSTGGLQWSGCVFGANERPNEPQSLSLPAKQEVGELSFTFKPPDGCAGYPATYNAVVCIVGECEKTEQIHHFDSHHREHIITDLEVGKNYSLKLAAVSPIGKVSLYTKPQYHVVVGTWVSSGTVAGIVIAVLVVLALITCGVLGCVRSMYHSGKKKWTIPVTLPKKAVRTSASSMRPILRNGVSYTTQPSVASGESGIEWDIPPSAESDVFLPVYPSNPDINSKRRHPSQEQNGNFPLNGKFLENGNFHEKGKFSRSNEKVDWTLDTSDPDAMTSYSQVGLKGRDSGIYQPASSTPETHRSRHGTGASDQFLPRSRHNTGASDIDSATHTMTDYNYPVIGSYCKLDFNQSKNSDPNQSGEIQPLIDFTEASPVSNHISRFNKRKGDGYLALPGSDPNVYKSCQKENPNPPGKFQSGTRNSRTPGYVTLPNNTGFNSLSLDNLNYNPLSLPRVHKETSDKPMGIVIPNNAALSDDDILEDSANSRECSLPPYIQPVVKFVNRPTANTPSVCNYVDLPPVKTSPVNSTPTDGYVDHPPVNSTQTDGYVDHSPVKPTSTDGNVDHPPVNSTSTDSYVDHPPVNSTSTDGYVDHPPVKSTSTAGYVDHPPVNSTPIDGYVDHPPVNSKPIDGYVDHPPVNSTPTDGYVVHPPVNSTPTDRPQNKLPPISDYVDNNFKGRRPSANQTSSSDSGSGGFAPYTYKPDTPVGDFMDHPFAQLAPVKDSFDHPSAKSLPNSDYVDQIPVKTSAGSAYVDHPPTKTSPVSDYVDHPPTKTSPVSDYVDHPPVKTSPVSDYVDQPPVKTSPVSDYVDHPTANTSPVSDYVDQPPVKTSPVSDYVDQPPVKTSSVSDYVDQPPVKTSPVSDYVDQPPVKTTPVSDYVDQPPVKTSPVSDYVDYPTAKTSPVSDYVDHPPTKSSPSSDYVDQPPAKTSPVSDYVDHPPTKSSPRSDYVDQPPAKTSPVSDYIDHPPAKTSDYVENNLCSRRPSKNQTSSSDSASGGFAPYTYMPSEADDTVANISELNDPVKITDSDYVDHPIDNYVKTTYPDESIECRDSNLQAVKVDANFVAGLMKGSSDSAKESVSDEFENVKTDKLGDIVKDDESVDLKSDYVNLLTPSKTDNVGKNPGPVYVNSVQSAATPLVSEQPTGETSSAQNKQEFVDKQNQNDKVFDNEECSDSNYLSNRRDKPRVSSIYLSNPVDRPQSVSSDYLTPPPNQSDRLSDYLAPPTGQSDRLSEYLSPPSNQNDGLSDYLTPPCDSSKRLSDYLTIDNEKPSDGHLDEYLTSSSLYDKNESQNGAYLTPPANQSDNLSDYLSVQNDNSMSTPAEYLTVN